MNPCPANTTTEQYKDYIIPQNSNVILSLQKDYPAACVDYVDIHFLIAHIPLTDNSQPPLNSYLIMPSLYTLMDNSSMSSAGIITTFKQPYLSLQGQGTLIGFIDTGIDYQNPLFQNADHTTRILSLWDQTISSDTTPTPASPEHPESTVPYGTIYSRKEINEALASEHPLDLVPSIDENGHGTFCAGIAAGGESLSDSFIGAASNCSIAVVKLKPAKESIRQFYSIQESAIAYQENDVMMGVRFLELLAQEHSLPLVIYIGLGTNYGSHEGTSPLCTMLRRISQNIGMAVVLPAGNEAGYRHHYLGHIEQSQKYQDAEILVSEKENGFTVELWASEPEFYSVGFISPMGQEIPRIPINATNTTISFSLEATRITVIYGLSEYSSGSESIFIRFNNPTSGIWRIRVYNSLHITGDYHMWLPVKGFISDETYFIHSNPYTIITEPGNIYIPITVGTYDHYTEQLYIHSSRGYNRFSSIKPELVAPGVDVYGPGLSSPGSNQYPMVRKTGSSISAAHVAGAAASLLTWGIVYGNDLTMTSYTIKAILIRGADRSSAYPYPNREWGFGALNLYQSFLRLRD